MSKIKKGPNKNKDTKKKKKNFGPYFLTHCLKNKTKTKKKGRRKNFFNDLD